MVQAIEFAVRNSAGAVVHGTAGGGGANFIQIGSGEQVSLHLSQSSVLGYERKGNDLIVKLVDGGDMTLSGFYNVQPGHLNRLYLSANGEVTEVMLQNAGEGPIVASYGPVDAWNKFSTLDDLRFEAGDAYADAQIYSDEPAGMAALAPGLMGVSGLGAAAIAAGLLGGAALLGGGGDDDDDTVGDDDDDNGGDDDDDNGGDDDDDDNGGDDDDDDDHTPPTVDNPDADSTLTTNTQDPKLVVTGTGHPGDTVVVVIGKETQTTTIGSDGKWGVEFKGDTFPADGDYSSTVTVTGGGQTWTLDGPDFLIDMTPPPVDATVGVESVGDVENGSEYKDGVTIGGTSEAGATVAVTIGGATHSVVADAKGNWSVTFTTTQIASGEHTVAATITATDPLGNKTTITENVVIDTLTNVAFNDVQMTDNVISGGEKAAAAGITLSGTGEAGASISVVFEGLTRTTTVGADGTWKVNYAGTEIRSGTYDSTVTVTTKDKAGNTATDSHVVKVDTEVSGKIDTYSTHDNKDDAILNKVEAQDGLTITGTVEANTEVLVSFDGKTFHKAIVTGTSWTVTIPPGEIPAGEKLADVVVKLKDQYGNTATLTDKLAVDQVVTGFSVGKFAGDNVLNAEEREAGVKLSGTVEPGSTVFVELANGEKAQVVANATGNWSVTFTAGQLPEMANGTMNASVYAVDKAGNVTSTTVIPVTVDTELPDVADFREFTKTVNNGVTGVTLDTDGDYTATSEDHYSFTRVNTDGTHQTLSANSYNMDGDTLFKFSNGGLVPDGSYLVVTAEDQAGNEASSLIIVDNKGTVGDVNLSNAGLSDFDFSQIDLREAAGAKLTLSAADLERITGLNDELLIKGGSDDTVNLTGFETATRVTEGGYHIITLGDTVLRIEDDVTVNTI